MDANQDTASGRPDEWGSFEASGHQDSSQLQAAKVVPIVRECRFQLLSRPSQFALRRSPLSRRSVARRSCRRPPTAHPRRSLNDKPRPLDCRPHARRLSLAHHAQRPSRLLPLAEHPPPSPRLFLGAPLFPCPSTSHRPPRPSVMWNLTRSVQRWPLRFSTALG